ncbi:MAG: hypothetical protein LW716_12470 [Microcystis sp. 53602_E8]|nr:hypothetical protein [Microcystis sp. 53602_E8]
MRYAIEERTNFTEKGLIFVWVILICAVGSNLYTFNTFDLYDELRPFDKKKWGILLLIFVLSHFFPNSNDYTNR